MDRPDPYVFQEARLSCGGLAVWQHHPQVRYVHQAIIVRVGSNDDPPGKKGLAHLSEHLSFEGTKRYRDILALATAVESHGGTFTAFTDHEHTTFLVGTPYYECQLGSDVLDQMVIYQLNRQKDVVRQKRDVRNEISAYENGFPPKKAKEFMYQRLFGSAAAVQADVLGSHETLARITVEDVRDFHQRYYRPANMIYLAVGNLSGLSCPWNEWVESRIAKFGGRQTAAQPCFVPQLSRHSDPLWATSSLVGLNHPWMTVAGRLHEYDRLPSSDWHRRERVDELIKHILVTRGMSSVLSMLLRTRYHLIYGCESSLPNFVFPGHYWTIDSGVDRRVDVVRYFSLIARAMRDPDTFSRSWVESAQQAILGKLAMADVTPSDAFRWAIEHIASGQPITTYESYENGYRQVTQEKVQAVVAEDYHPDRWVALAYYPQDE